LTLPLGEGILFHSGTARLSAAESMRIGTDVADRAGNEALGDGRKGSRELPAFADHEMAGQS
jgi:hypothetical protein